MNRYLPRRNDQKVTYKSSNAKVATVDKNGKVTAKKSGKATITVTTNDGKKTAKCIVLVSDMTISSSNITKARSGLKWIVTPKLTNAVIKSVTSSNKKVATVTYGKSSFTIKLTNKAGNATIKVTTNTGITKTIRISMK